MFILCWCLCVSPCWPSSHWSALHSPCPCSSPGNPHTGTPPAQQRSEARVTLRTSGRPTLCGTAQHFYCTYWEYGSGVQNQLLLWNMTDASTNRRIKAEKAIRNLHMSGWIWWRANLRFQALIIFCLYRLFIIIQFCMGENNGMMWQCAHESHEIRSMDTSLMKARDDYQNKQHLKHHLKLSGFYHICILREEARKVA